jgi:hypothetical protein
MTARLLVFPGALSLVAASAQTLPSGAEGHAALFIVGFSHASSKPTSAWDKQLGNDCAETGTTCYTVAVLQDVPRFVRGMAVSGIRSGIPKDKRATFLILLHDEDVWKKLCGFSDPDGAYLLLVSRTGQIVWKWAGPADAASLATARERLRAAAKN